jgi:hypothetical protein
MAKDPAILFYRNDWLVATKTMRADEKGWYLNLILFQFDMGDLPGDIEELAVLCDVRMSEYERFNQAWQQVLKHKFKQNDKGRLYNEVAETIIKKREQFKDKRSESGKWGYIIKFMKANKIKASDEEIDRLRKDIDVTKTDTKDKQELKQVLKQLLKLYRNENENTDIDYKGIVKYYNDVCSGLPKVEKLTDSRKALINARYEEYGKEAIGKVIKLASKSGFLTGDNERGWKADFDFIFTASKFIKILEGTYSNNKKAHNPHEHVM